MSYIVYTIFCGLLLLIVFLRLIHVALLISSYSFILCSSYHMVIWLYISCIYMVHTRFLSYGSHQILLYTTACLCLLFIVDYLDCYQVVTVLDKATRHIHSWKGLFMHIMLRRPDSDTEYPMLLSDFFSHCGDI